MDFIHTSGNNKIPQIKRVRCVSACVCVCACDDEVYKRNTYWVNIHRNGESVTIIIVNNRWRSNEVPNSFQ